MNHIRGWLVTAVSSALLAACSDYQQSTPQFEELPPPLTNVSRSLEAVLEQGTLAEACNEYAASPNDQHLKLKCGKYQFFYEGFDTLGVPVPIMRLLIEDFSEYVGPGFVGLGMYEDPYSEQRFPLGFGETQALSEDVNAVAYTCAACHFSQTDDGLYVVGLANHNLLYGDTLAYMTVAPAVATGVGIDSHPPESIARVSPAVEQALAEGRFNSIIDKLLSLRDIALDPVPFETEQLWMSWQPGVLDFFTFPFPEDGVHIPIRIPSLFDIPTRTETAQFNMRHALLTAAGGGGSLESFVRGFVLTSGGDLERWDAEARSPLVDYIYSLRAPQNRNPPDAAQAGRGRDLFERQGCLDCHDGKAYSGRELFSFAEIGTDDALRYFSDPELDGTFCCGIVPDADSELTQALKAPRLTGIWAHKRFLHNGSLSSLEELLCLNPRAAEDLRQGMSNRGHEYGCELSLADKQDLLAFLRSL